MAKSTLNPVFKQINGQIGDLVFREVRGKTVISQKADVSHLERSEAQLAAQARFREGALYGKAVMADPTLKALYAAAAKAKKKPIFSLMVAHYFHAPTITAVSLDNYTGAAGDAIQVTAFDDFEVTAVTVSLVDGGTVLESGTAVVENGRWTNTTTTSVTPGTTVTVTATALDRPGNSGSAEATVLIS